MSSELETLRNDAAELYRLVGLTDRRKVKDILSIEAKKIETKISLLQEKGNIMQPKSTIVTTAKRAYEVKITNFAWDQNNFTVRIVVSLTDVHTIPSENIVCEFTDSSFDLLVKELNGKTYTLSVKNLYQLIKPENSFWKVKPDCVKVSLTKLSPEHWSALTKPVKDLSIPKSSKIDEGDPSAGVMNLLKQMYMEGDDEMKRTIAKAWTESREKSETTLNF